MRKGQTALAIGYQKVPAVDEFVQLFVTLREESDKIVKQVQAAGACINGY